MSKVFGTLKSNSAYVLLVLAVVWLGFSVYLGSYYVLWPVVALGLAGVFLKVWPGERLTWAWSKAAVVLGLLLSAYTGYAAWPFTGGVFSTAAIVTVAVFAVFALVHLAVLYMGSQSVKQAKQD